MPSRASTRSLKEMTWIPLVWSETYDETTSSVSLKFAFVLLSFPLHSVCDAGCHFYLCFLFFGYILKPYVRVEVIVVNRHFVVFSNGDSYKLIWDHVCWDGWEISRRVWLRVTICYHAEVVTELLRRKRHRALKTA